MTERTATAAIGGDDRALARHALENVCSTADPGRAVGVPSRDFLAARAAFPETRSFA